MWIDRYRFKERNNNYIIMNLCHTAQNLKLKTNLFLQNSIFWMESLGNFACNE